MKMRQCLNQHCGGSEFFSVSDPTIKFEECPCCGYPSSLIERRDEDDEDDGEHDQFLSDAEADADALASCGWGCDEDYGYYGDDY